MTDNKLFPEPKYITIIEQLLLLFLKPKYTCDEIDGCVVKYKNFRGKIYILKTSHDKEANS